jgi:CxxC-x17-CxxC domain-containing protein
MKRKAKNKNDTAIMMTQIQEQLALLNQKLDSFMTKSLTELAQAMATTRPVVQQQVVAQAPARPPQHNYQTHRTMFAVVCYECGKDTEIPFKPSGNRPVYCKECFALRKGRAASGNVRITNAPVYNSRPTAVASTPAVKKKRKAVKKKKSATKRKPITKKKKISKKKVTKKKAVRKTKAKKKKSRR